MFWKKMFVKELLKGNYMYPFKYQPFYTDYLNESIHYVKWGLLITIIIIVVSYITNNIFFLLIYLVYVYFLVYFLVRIHNRLFKKYFKFKGEQK